MEEVSNGMQARVEVRNPWFAILPLMLGAFVGMFSETALNIALPQLMKALAVGQSSIQWLVTGYMLVIGIVLPLSSLLTKWFTTKQLVISGLVFFYYGITNFWLWSKFFYGFSGKNDPRCRDGDYFAINVHSGDACIPTKQIRFC